MKLIGFGIPALALAACAGEPAPQAPQDPPRVPITETGFRDRVVGNTVQKVRHTRFNKFYFGPDGRYVMAGFAGLNDSLLSIQGGTYSFDAGTICMKREWRDGNQNTGCLTIETVGDGIRCSIRWGSSTRENVFTCSIGEGPHPVIAEALDRR